MQMFDHCTFIQLNNQIIIKSVYWWVVRSPKIIKTEWRFSLSYVKIKYINTDLDPSSSVPIACYLLFSNLNSFIDNMLYIFSYFNPISYFSNNLRYTNEITKEKSRRQNIHLNQKLHTTRIQKFVYPQPKGTLNYILQTLDEIQSFK